MPPRRRSQHQPWLTATRTRGCSVLILILLGGISGGQVLVPEDSLPRDLFTRSLPFGLPDLPVDGLPHHELRFGLGRRLFFDPLLSSEKTVACASCHRPEAGFASPERFPMGVRGRRAQRHAPTLFNRAYGSHQSWDGRATSLAEQVILPISNPNEMDLPLGDALGRLRESESYRNLFDKAYPTRGVAEETLADALRSFVGRLTFGNSPVDRFRAAVPNSLSREEKGGLWIYESKGRCWRCHSGPNFTDENFHNTGVGGRSGTPAPGRFGVTQIASDLGRFKTPTLRGLSHSAPYMHDGSLATLEEVVTFYRRGGEPNRNIDPLMQPLNVTDTQAAMLVAFLKALSREER